MELGRLEVIKAMKHHQISLSGSASKGARISATTLTELLEILVEGSRAAVRLRLEGRSIAKGADPGWLVQAADFDLIGFSQGSTVLDIEAPSLNEAVPERFTDQARIDSSITALSAFEESFVEAANGIKDSELFDDGFLDICLRMQKVFSFGFDSISLRGGERHFTVEKEALDKIAELRRQIPTAKRVVVAGTLDSIRHSDRVFELTLQGGNRIKGIANESDAQRLNEFWGQNVLIQGMLSFHASGRVALLQAESVQTAADKDFILWSKLPTAGRKGAEPCLQMHRQGPSSGLGKIKGLWPGDESDADLIEALKSIS